MLCGVKNRAEAVGRPIVVRASHNAALHVIEIMWSST